MGPWKSNPDFPVRSQWTENELEHLNEPGHVQCHVLGKWFNSYVSRNCLGKDSSRVFFRSSSSGRGKESGIDFIRGFNTERQNPVNEVATPYENNEKADNYFRPWKILPTFTDTLKNRCANDALWADKATENKEFLEKIFTRIGASSVLSKMPKALWSTTYLFAVKECELFWPVVDGRNRRVLTSMLNEEEWEHLTKLACWVWEERFVRSGFTISMGGKLLNEILTRALDPHIDVSIYSGHDYTVLASLSLLGLIPQLESPANFSCYIMYELWDGLPPPHPSGPAKKAAVGHSESSPYILRVIFNTTPFDHDTPLGQLQVNTGSEKVLGEFSLGELHDIINTAQSEFHLFEKVKPVKLVKEFSIKADSIDEDFPDTPHSKSNKSFFDVDMIAEEPVCGSPSMIDRNFSKSTSDLSVGDGNEDNEVFDGNEASLVDGH